MLRAQLPRMGLGQPPQRPPVPLLPLPPWSTPCQGATETLTPGAPSQVLLCSSSPCPAEPVDPSRGLRALEPRGGKRVGVWGGWAGLPMGVSRGGRGGEGPLVEAPKVQRLRGRDQALPVGGWGGLGREGALRGAKSPSAGTQGPRPRLQVDMLYAGGSVHGPSPSRHHGPRPGG